MNTRSLLVQAGAMLVMANSLMAAGPTTAPKAIPTKIAETVAAINKIEKPAWTKDVEMTTDRGCSMSFYGDKEGLHRIRIIVGLSNSDVTCDFYYSGTSLVYVSQHHQVVITYVDDGKEIREVHKPDPKIDELKLGFTEGKLVYDSRKGDYFEGEIATLAQEALKEAKELNAITEKDKTVNLEHWQK